MLPAFAPLPGAPGEAVRGAPRSDVRDADGGVRPRSDSLEAALGPGVPPPRSEIREPAPGVPRSEILEAAPAAPRSDVREGVARRGCRGGVWAWLGASCPFPDLEGVSVVAALAGRRGLRSFLAESPGAGLVAVGDRAGPKAASAAAASDAALGGGGVGLFEGGWACFGGRAGAGLRLALGTGLWLKEGPGLLLGGTGGLWLWFGLSVGIGLFESLPCSGSSLPSERGGVAGVDKGGGGVELWPLLFTRKKKIGGKGRTCL